LMLVHNISLSPFLPLTSPFPSQVSLSSVSSLPFLFLTSNFSLSFSCHSTN
jgi:hypothetical protein